MAEPFGNEVTRAVLSDMYWVPSREIDPHRVRDRFTIKKETMVFGTNKREVQPIPTYREGTGKLLGMTGLPIATGMEYFPCDNITEDFSDGAPFDAWTRRPDPHHPLAPKGQDEFMEEAYDAVTGLYTSLLKAETGTGKTVVFLDVAARIGLRPLILVPLERLMHQWIEEVVDKLGVPRKDIGVVQGTKCQWGRQIVVGMMKSVASRTYPAEFYNAFGLVGYDETHNLGASVAATTQGLFNARYKTSLSATPLRKDGADKVYLDYFGHPAFERTMAAVPTRVSVLSYISDKPVTGSNKSAKLIGLAYDFERNKIICEFAQAWYEGGYTPLFVTEHFRHADILRKMFVSMGIPNNKIAMYTGEQKEEDGTRGKTTKEYLDWAEKNCDVFIATYGMMKEGIDIPKMDRGMDCTPRAEFEQILGRIRRKHKGKDDAHWVTIRDRTVPSFEGNYFNRIKSIAHLTGVVVERLDKYAILQRL